MAALVVADLFGNANGTGGGPRNLPGNQSGGGNTFSLTTPAQVKAFLMGEAREFIPGLSANKDTRTYPLLTGRQ
jgi:hypothetical protein